MGNKGAKLWSRNTFALWSSGPSPNLDQASIPVILSLSSLYQKVRALHFVWRIGRDWWYWWDFQGQRKVPGKPFYSALEALTVSLRQPSPLVCLIPHSFCCYLQEETEKCLTMHLTLQIQRTDIWSCLGHLNFHQFMSETFTENTLM